MIDLLNFFIIQFDIAIWRSYIFRENHYFCLFLISRYKMPILGQVALNDPAQKPYLGNECTQ